MSIKQLVLSKEEIKLVEEYRANKLKQQEESKKRKEKEEQYNELKKTEKYKILLELLNKILSNCGKNEIKDVLNFVRVDRKDMIKYDVLNDKEMIKKVFGPFNRKECKWYNRNKIKYFTITILKYMCENLELKLVSKEKRTQQNHKNKKYTLEHSMMYSIKNI